MILARTLLSKLRPARPTRRELQEQYDASRVALLTAVFRETRAGGAPDRAALEQEVSTLDPAQRRKRTQAELNKQVVAYFRLVQESREESQAAVRRRAARTQQDDFHSVLPGATSGSDPDPAEEELRRAVREELGFCPSVRPSTIPGAGLGLFVDGTALEGAVVALYPGLVHLPENLIRDEYVAALLPDPDFFLMARADGTVVDGRTAEILPSSPLAVAHMANHPPPSRMAHSDTAGGEGAGDRGTAGGAGGGGGEANVLQAAYDYPAAGASGSGGGLFFPEELRRFLPNRYHLPPRLLGGKVDRSALVETVALVATRDLRDEEVLMNYRFNPKLPAPSWYVPVDPGEAEERWAVE